MKPLSVRFTSEELYQRVEALAKEHGLSMNMTVNMLLGYAFNEIDATGKKFVATIVFESEPSATDL